jgi:uncharacterized membrane protein
MYRLALILHLLSVIVWIGGMFFSHAVLRPAAIPLEHRLRLELWNRVLALFFRYVWIAVVLLLTTGFWIIFDLYGGFAGLPVRIHFMTGLGLVMIANFTFIYTAPYAAFRRAVDDQLYDVATLKQGTIRRLILANLVLGTSIIVVGLLFR